MQQGKYIILRESNLVDLSDPFSGRSFFLRDRFLPQGLGVSLDLESSLTSRDIADLRRDPQVVSIAPSMPVRLIKPVASEAVDGSHEGKSTWGVMATGADCSPYTGKGITVAVLDTGIDANHEAFQGVNIVEKDFTGEGNGDKEGHGTHCAGTIFGQVIGGLRFGVAPGVEKALIGKVLSAQGGSTEQIYQGILWAVDQGANIISMSLGMDFPGYVQFLVQSQRVPADLATSMALEAYRANVRLFDNLAALIRARSSLLQGTIVVAAAGNESKREINAEYEVAVAPPAAADGIISVGALQTSGAPHNNLTIANFSNTGPNISGPGVGVYSAKAGGGYVKYSGTSMAAPHVAGIAALWAEKLKQVTASDNFSAMELSARLIGNATRDKLAASVEPLDVGAGLVQAPM